MGSWWVIGALVLAAALLGWRWRRDAARHAAAWDGLARDFMLGFDAGTRTIRGKYRLLRVECAARRAWFGLGPWETHVTARYEGVVPEGLTLALGGGGLRASARSSDGLAAWLEGHARRERIPALLAGGVHVSGHTLALVSPGLVTDAEALRTLLARLAELAKLLSQR